MKPLEIYIAYVAWESGGKRRPVLIIAESVDSVTAFSITTRYEDKSGSIRAGYFLINEWQKAGLDRPSFVDTNRAVAVPKTAVDNHIGKLTATDAARLLEFIRQ